MFFYVCRTRKQRYGNLPAHAWAESGRAHRRNSPCGFFQGRELCSWMREETGRLIGPSIPLVLSNFEPPEYIYSKNNINYSKIKSFKISEISRTRQNWGWVGFLGDEESQKVLSVHLPLGPAAQGWWKQRRRDWTDHFSLAVTLVKLLNSSLSILHLWSGMVRVLTSPGHWITACQAHYCALTYIISLNFFEKGMIIIGLLGEAKTVVQGHTAKNKFEPRSLSLWTQVFASKGCACNNYTNLASVPWRLKSRDRHADGRTWHRTQS